MSIIINTISDIRNVCHSDRFDKNIHFRDMKITYRQRFGLPYPVPQPSPPPPLYRSAPPFHCVCRSNDYIFGLGINFMLTPDMPDIALFPYKPANVLIILFSLFEVNMKLFTGTIYPTNPPNLEPCD